MGRIMRSHGAEKGTGALIAIIVVLVLCLCFFGLALASSNSDKIIKGTTINNVVEIGGMTTEQAKEALAEYQTQLANKPFVLRFQDRTNMFHGSDISVQIKDESVDKALKIGKDGNIFTNGVMAVKSIFGAKNNIDADVVFDEKALYDRVDDLVQSAGAAAVDSTYEVKGDYIEIFKGHDGIRVNYETLRNDIAAHVTEIDSSSDIDVSAEINRAQEIDIEDLYRSVYVEVKDAQISADGTYTAEQTGISFDKLKALTDYRALANDSKMTIKLDKTEPEITTKNLEKVLFADVLGTFQTKYVAANTNRSTNLALAANNINGTILLPGDEFSYNQAVGERTAARGFKEAHVYSGGQVVDGLGGGICQISSTLYNAVLKADLEVTERKNHMFWPEYVNPSFDATVAWGSIDFKFKNSRKSPVRITASAKGGIATVTIYGRKEDDEPTISLEWVKLEEYQPTTRTQKDNTMYENETKVIQTAVKGYKSEGYKVYKDIKGKEIKRVKVSTDTYKATDKIVAVGTKKVETPIVIPDPEPVTPVEEPVTQTPTEQPNTGNTGNTGTGWPTGWDTPENPNYRP